MPARAFLSACSDIIPNLAPQVNGKLQSSNPDIYAIGDIAAYPLKRYGTTTRQEHVKNARQTGALAISHILDPSNTEDFNYLPFFYSRIFDLGWQVGQLTFSFMHWQTFDSIRAAFLLRSCVISLTCNPVIGHWLALASSTQAKS